MTATPKTFADFASSRKKYARSCPICGADTAGQVTISLRQLGRNGGRAQSLISKTLAFCEPCSLARFDELVADLKKGRG